MFEGANLLAILSEDQYLKFLFLKVQGKGIEAGKSDWAKLKRFGLSQDLDSVKTCIQSINYETKMLVAIEKLKNDNSQKNVFAKKEIENKKPDFLKKLDLVVKNEAVDKTARNALTW